MPQAHQGLRIMSSWWAYRGYTTATLSNFNAVIYLVQSVEEEGGTPKMSRVSLSLVVILTHLLSQFVTRTFAVPRSATVNIRAIWKRRNSLLVSGVTELNYFLCWFSFCRGPCNNVVQKKKTERKQQQTMSVHCNIYTSTEDYFKLKTW